MPSRSASPWYSTSLSEGLANCSKHLMVDPCPSDLIGIVASAKEYQEDFQRRIRDLRSLGWQIKASRRYHEGARVRVYYRLLHYEPWPENIHAAIKAAERRNKEARKL